MAYSNDTKPAEGQSGVIGGGQPFGLLFLITKAGEVLTGGYVFDDEPSIVSYTNDTKPS